MTKKQKQTVFMAGILAAVLIGAVFVWNRPKLVVADAIRQLAEAETAHFSTTLSLGNTEATKQILSEEGAVTLELNGIFARQEDAQDNLQAEVALTTKTESISIGAEGEFRFIGDKTYMYIKKAPKVFPILSQVKGNWIELPRGGTTAQDDTVPSDEVLFTSVKRGGSEEINGERTTRYQVIASSAAVVRLMDGIAQVLGTSLTQDQIDNLRSSFAGVDKVPLQIWVKPLTHQLRQLKTSIAVPGGNTIDFTLQVSDLNRKVSITTPENPQTFEELLSLPPKQ